MSGTVERRIFSPLDQEAFAKLSGDCNPMHLDAVAARRTMAGAPVVHGMHLLLWGMETVARGVDDLSVGRIRAQFNGFVLVGESVHLEVTPAASGWRLSFSVDGEARALVLADRDALTAQAASSAFSASAALQDRRTAAKRAGLDTVAPGSEGFVALGGCGDSAFPRLNQTLGAGALRSLLALTYVVGMELPGLHSIFGGLDVRLSTDGAGGGLHYQLLQKDARFRMVRLAVLGPGLSGEVKALFRPEPKEQPGMHALASLVQPSAFRGASALVVGGSRGLGALCARLLALGGSDVTITFNVGEQEASALAREIEDRPDGGRCSTLRYDLFGRDESSLGRAGPFDAMFYFASPPIRKSNRTFNPALFQSELAAHVFAFERAVTAVSDSQPTRQLKVFYPSSVFVEDAPRGFTEYAMAKASGERLCQALAMKSDQLSVNWARLPQLPTDQTAGISEEDLPPAGSVLAPVVIETMGL